MLRQRGFDKEPIQNFQVHDYIYIERSNHDIEAWLIIAHLSNGEYKVKPSVDANMYREYTLSEIQALNPDGPLDQVSMNLMSKAYHWCYKHSLRELFIDQSVDKNWYIEVVSTIIEDIESTQRNKQRSPILRKFQKRLEKIKYELLNTDAKEIETNNLISEIYPNGITSNLEQGRIGTCYLLSALKAIKLHPSLMRLLIKQSISKKDSNTWVVKFLGDENNIGPIEVSKDKLKKWKKQSGLKAADGDIIFELAYASYVSRSKGRTKGTMFTEDSGNYSVEGGYAHRTLAHLLGPIGIKYRKTPNHSNYEHRSFANANDHHSTQDFFNNNYLRNRNNLIVTASSEPSKHGDTDYAWVEREKIYKSHAYTIVDFNPNTQKISISNPHNSQKTFELSINGFNQVFYDLKFNKLNRLAMVTVQLEKFTSEDLCREILKSELSQVDLSILTGSNFFYQNNEYQRDTDHLFTNLNYSLEEIKNPLLKKVFTEEVNLALLAQNISIRI